MGDIVYIKAAFGGAQNITVKGIGVIKDNVVRSSHDTNNLVSTGRNVVWLSKGLFTIPRPQEKNNVRSNTVYEEFHPMIQEEIIRRISLACGESDFLAPQSGEVTLRSLHDGADDDLEVNA